jgi:hypothetical protein
MKIEELDMRLVEIGVLFFEDYCTPYVETTWQNLDLMIQNFRFMLDKIYKINNLIEESKELMEGRHKNNCIGENETFIAYESGFFKYYSAAFGYDYFLELEQSAWIILLERIKEYMLKVNNEKRLIAF